MKPGFTLEKKTPGQVCGSRPTKRWLKVTLFSLLSAPRQEPASLPFAALTLRFTARTSASGGARNVRWTSANGSVIANLICEAI